MDEYWSAHIHHPQDNVANIEIDDAEGGFHQGHEEELERVDLANDDPEADEDRGGHQTSLDDINEANFDDEVIAHLLTNQRRVLRLLTNHNTAMTLSNIPVNIDQQKL